MGACECMGHALVREEGLVSSFEKYPGNLFNYPRLALNSYTKRVILLLRFLDNILFSSGSNLSQRTL